MNETDSRPTAEQPEMRAADIRMSRDARGRLVFKPTLDALPVENVRAARCFPWTLRSGYISIRDSAGKELCLVRDPGELNTETRHILETELAAQEFLPTVTAIQDVNNRTEVALWHVITDSGPIELQVTHAEDVRQLDDGRILIRDHAGGIFQVPDPANLDSRSRMLLEDHLP